MNFSSEASASKTLANFCLFALFMSRDIVKIWMVRFGKPPVIHQIRKVFHHQKFSLYSAYTYMHTFSVDIHYNSNVCSYMQYAYGTTCRIW